jgi:hypothetical protein
MRLGEALSVQGSHAWRGDSAVFDDDNLVSHAGLVALMELAEQVGLSALLDEHVRLLAPVIPAATPIARACETIMFARTSSVRSRS